MSINLDLNIIDSLAHLGLSDKEAKVYMGLLQIGEMSAVKLGRDLGLHRQFVYNALTSLKERGLVVQIGTERAKWRAQSPRKLVSHAEEQQIKAEKAVEQLLALRESKEGQEFEVTEGSAVFRSRFLESIRRAPEKSTVRMICGEWKRYFQRAGEVHALWDKIRISKGIEFKMIGTASLSSAMKASAERDLVAYRILPGMKENLVNTLIYENEVVTEMYGEPHITFSIKNPDITKSQKDFFEVLWALAQV